MGCLNSCSEMPGYGKKTHTVKIAVSPGNSVFIGHASNLP
jgi:hypothetical protein